MKRTEIITLIVSIAAMLLAGFTLLRNPEQSPAAYGVVMQPDSHIKVDTIGEIKKRQVYHIWKVLYTAPVKYSVKAKGLPTYDSLMINEPFARNVLQGGNDFDPELFMKYTYNANRVVAWWLIR